MATVSDPREWVRQRVAFPPKGDSSAVRDEQRERLASANPARDPPLAGAVARQAAVGVTTHGYIHPLRVTKHVPPGMYRITILATEALGFELIGHGISRRTKTCLGGAGSVPCWQRLFAPANTSWTVRLRRATYRYRAVGPGVSSLRPRPTSGSFQVP